MHGDQITAIRQLRSEGKTLVEIAGQVGLEIGDVQTAVNMLDFMAEQTTEGGASPQKVVKFPFAHDTPGLTDGVDIYTPEVGDLLLDAWVEVDEAWDGTTPNADIGTFVGSVHGLYTDPSGANAIINLGGAAQAVGGLRVQYLFNLGTAALYPGGSPRFISEDPLKLVVSQDGTLGGADPGATQGAATAYALVLSP